LTEAAMIPVVVCVSDLGSFIAVART